jgi:hypothetical protein
MQKVVRATERHVRDYTKRLRRQLKERGVALHHLDIRPPATQPAGQPRVELNRHNSPGNARELARQASRARTEVDHQVARTDTGITDDVRRQPARGKEVLTTRRRRPRATCAPTCHGTAP